MNHGTERRRLTGEYTSVDGAPVQHEALLQLDQVGRSKTTGCQPPGP